MSRYNVTGFVPSVGISCAIMNGDPEDMCKEQGQKTRPFTLLVLTTACQDEALFLEPDFKTAPPFPALSPELFAMQVHFRLRLHFDVPLDPYLAGQPQVFLVPQSRKKRHRPEQQPQVLEHPHPVDVLCSLLDMDATARKIPQTVAVKELVRAPIQVRPFAQRSLPQIRPRRNFDALFSLMNLIVGMVSMFVRWTREGVAGRSTDPTRK